MQISSPKAVAYLLGLPDHYTSHKFKPFYWRYYVQRALESWADSGEGQQAEVSEPKVTIHKYKDRYYQLDPVQDYTHRPNELEHITLYEWITQYQKKKNNESQ
ncbi:hypothetical protein M422DRAFT_176339 [Sphaerobolus stellatus SS14]|uniref:Uncharacterized protein n=1 Tax=Sphaerobolus stellatus (strain SS14) TaxID=990650 RepID=A0A0C9U6I8_SPHS4|nr:hypothetical protein M422DRAFT_176339 [Sphaerobolus stellatus SS14]